MKTIYDNNISNKPTSDYLDYLINKVYALLPSYEESRVFIEKSQSFGIYQNTLIQTINGHFNLINYDSYIAIDILSHLESLKSLDNHADYKRHILKICKLLSILKKEVEKDGF
jgi:hypothetical protein